MNINDMFKDIFKDKKDTHCKLYPNQTYGFPCSVCKYKSECTFEVNENE